MTLTQAIKNASAMTLIQAIENAFLYNAKWKAAVLEDSAVKQDSFTAKMAFAPSANVNLSTGPTYTKSKSSSEGVKNPDQQNKEYSKQAGLSVNQKILDFSSFAQIKNANESVLVSNSNLQKIKQDVIIETLSAYMGLWAARENVKISEKNEQNIEQDLLASRKRLEVGIGILQDVAANEAAYAEAVYYRIDAQAKLATAVAEFEKTVGVMPNGDLVMPGLPKNIPDELGKFLASALKDNPSVKQSRYQESVALSSVDVQKGALMPNVTLSANASRNLGERNTKTPSSIYPTVNNQSSNLSAKIELTVPLLAFSNYSRIKHANIKAESAHMNYQLTRQEIEKSCYSLWAQFETSKAQIKQAELAVKSAEIAAKGMRQCLTLGTKSTTDVLQQEQKLLQARRNSVEARRVFIITAYNLIALMGQLDLLNVVEKVNIPETEVGNVIDEEISVG